MFVERIGLEPITLTLPVLRSSQMSSRPFFVLDDNVCKRIFFVAANIMHYSEIIAMFAVNNSMKLRYADL